MVAKKPVKKASAPKKPAAKAKKAASPKPKPKPEKGSKPKIKKATPLKKASPKKPASPKKSPAKKAAAPASPAKKTAEAPKAAAAGGAAKLVILHTKECGCFKVRAERLQKAMKAANPNVSFSVNPEKAAKGSFVLKTEGGKELWSMKGLTRPFVPFKAVDFEELGAKLAAGL